MDPPKPKHFKCWNCGFNTKTMTEWGPDGHQTGMGAKCPKCQALQHEDFRPVEVVRAQFGMLGRVDMEFSDHMHWYANGVVTLQPYRLDPAKLQALSSACKLLGFRLDVRGKPFAEYHQHDPGCIWIAIQRQRVTA